ncbi:MAG: glycosyl transferase [Microbacteriaceae bacterium]|nr:glycosyl transferase [Microbacteriaceae bacterium]
MYRALATANAFAREGWAVTVLTATRDTFERLTGSDPDSEKFIDPNVKVVRIPFDTTGGESDLRKWSRSRLYSPLLWDYIRWTLSKFSFPEGGYGGWKEPLNTAAEGIHREHPVDLVIGSANPNVDFAPGQWLHRRYGIPYVMDQRDAWHLDVYTGKRIGTRLGRSNRLERRLIDNSAEAWFVNQPIRDWHAAEYPRRAKQFHVVANGFDPGFLNSRVTQPAQRSGYPTFGYLGTIYGPMPLRETLEGWRLARTESPVLAKSRLVFRGRLGHFAEPDARVADLLSEYSTDDVFHLGPVSKTKVSDVYRDFDALLLILGRSTYVTSGKVFEYAATGLPIAAVHHPDTAATSVLRGYPRLFAVSEPTAREVANVLIATAKHISAETPREMEEAKRWAEHLSRDAQILPRVRALRELVNSRQQEAP